AFCGVAVGDKEGAVAEFGGGLSAAEGSGTGAAESVDVDGPGGGVAVYAPGRARTRGCGDGDVACVESGVGRGGIVDAAPRGSVTDPERQPWRGADHGAGNPTRTTVGRLCGELCPAAVFEPEVEYAVGGGLIGAVENDQLSPVVVLDVANGEVEDARAGWCGEASCDGPADAECAGGEEPGSESDGSFH